MIPGDSQGIGYGPEFCQAGVRSAVDRSTPANTGLEGNGWGNERRSGCLNGSSLSARMILLGGRISRVSLGNVIKRKGVEL